MCSLGKWLALEAPKIFWGVRALLPTPLALSLPPDPKLGGGLEALEGCPPLGSRVGAVRWVSELTPEM